MKKQLSVIEHRWKIRTDSGPYLWEERDCAVCGLYDRRYKKVKDAQWEVSTPCIVPPPPTVSFDELVADLRKHKPDKPGCLKLEPYAMGNPERWMVGFRVENASEGVVLRPAIEVKSPLTIEHGWSLLLRWMMARDYDKFSPYRSTGVGSVTIQPRTCACNEDD